MKDAAQIIRDTVSMDSILSLYGYQTKHGTMPCPFHGEHNPSLKVYQQGRGWHCFGCGRGGSAIDFVMEHDGCNFRTAVRAIDEALGLDLFKDRNPFADEVRRASQRKLDLFESDLLEAISIKRNIIGLELGATARRISKIESIPKQERTADEWTELLAANDDAQYLEYLDWRFEELGKEVKQWRTEKRRPPAEAAKAR